MVLAHGWPWSSFAWHRVVEPLTDHFSVYWYDMPGFGQSDKALDQATGLDAQGEVFSEITKYWGLSSPCVWAHDFGGAITLRAQILHGCRYRRYLLMNVVAMRPWGSAFFDHVGRHIEAFDGLPPDIHAGLVSAYIGGALIKPLAEEDRDALETPWRDAEGQKAFYRQFAQADEALTAEIEPALGEISGDVHILWGEDDPWIPFARGQALSKAIGCDIEPLPNLGHLPQLESPDEVIARALPFLISGTI